jgi:SAM-dependent methyltransferase
MGVPGSKSEASASSAGSVDVASVDSIQRSYDEVPYASCAFPFTHPSRLAAVAQICGGLNTPPVATCRVLELGCASGGNLMPMAVQLPSASFFGVDLSTVQIEDGRDTIRQLALKNVELRAMNILDVMPELGQFDYILAHGVYSWVPPSVREKILSIFRNNLAPNGVAFVSFDVYPGRFTQMMVRELMLVHAEDRQAHQWQDRLAAGREMLDLLKQILQGQQTPFATLLRSEVEGLAALEDNVLLHSALGQINAPVFFHEFMDHAAAQGLQYVAEAIPCTTAIETFPPHIRQVIQGASKTELALEQLIDVLRKRALRKCVLTHADVRLDRSKNPQRMRGLYVASPARTAGDGQYTLPHGDTYGAPDALSQTLLATLIQAWPQSIAVDQLIGAADVTTAERICATLMQMLMVGLIDVDAHPPACTKTVSGKAAASALARIQATRHAAVTHLRHDQVVLPPLHRQLIQELDGLRSPAELADRVSIDVPPGKTRQEAIETALSELASNALIMS